MTASDPHRCPACGGPNRCGAARCEAAACWCMRVSAALPLPVQRQPACYCAACLAQRAASARSVPLER